MGRAWGLNRAIPASRNPPFDTAIR